jgi:ariadne-1
MCQKNWSVHGYNSTCNAFQEKIITESLDAQAQAQANLEKWLFYYDRFTNHELSAKLDRDLYDQTEEKMIEVQNTSGLSWIEARYNFYLPMQ